MLLLLIMSMIVVFIFFWDTIKTQINPERGLIDEKNTSVKNYSWTQFFTQDDEKVRIKDKLLKYGTKTMATVTRIDYCKVENALVYESERNRNPIYYGVPTFKVVYIFNPPFDAREENLEHHFYTHKDPAGILAIGDPLPILYNIEIKSAHSDTLKEYTEELVHSMPFPIVLNDPISLKEVICSSSSSACLKDDAIESNPEDQPSDGKVG